MKRNSKILLIGALLVSLVLIISAVSVAWIGQNNTYSGKLERANRYLESGDYNNAVLMYRAAIDMDETQADAYYGLYRAYYALGDMDMAATVLRVGFQATQQAGFQQMLEDFESQLLVDRPLDELANNKTAEPTLNASLLTLLSTATYGDYCMKYNNASGTFRGGDYIQKIEQLGVTLTYSGDRVDMSRSLPHSASMPNQIVLDNVMVLFGGGDSISFDTIKGFGSLTGTVKSNKTIRFNFNDCEVQIECDKDGTVTPESKHTIVPKQREAAVEAFEVKLVIKNATDNQPVGDAQIRLRPVTGGEAVEGVTDSFGEVTLEVETSGLYVASVEKDGFISEEFEFDVLSGASLTEQEFHISPEMSGEGIRFVLTWGSSPSDLDSHLIGETGNGGYVHTYFGNREVTKNGSVVAELDVDDTSGYGPETLTLHETSGEFEYLVDDFTDSGMIASSGATVKIYVGSSLYQTLTVPADVDDVWHVCTIRNGNIEITNRNDTAHNF